MSSELILTQSDFKLFLHRIRGHANQEPNRPKVKAEQTLYRDLELCNLHREWGYDVPACDIDFLEYDNCNPVALIEYKKRADWRTTILNKDANLMALTRLGNRAKIPVYCVFYNPDRSMFRVIPLNPVAKIRQGAMFYFETKKEVS